MSESRYNDIDGFLWHKAGMGYPNPDEMHLLGLSEKVCRVRAPASEQAKAGLENFAKEFGANALLDTYSTVLQDERGNITGEVAWYGRPALYAKPSVNGQFTESELRASFRQPQTLGALKIKTKKKPRKTEPVNDETQQIDHVLSVFAILAMYAGLFGALGPGPVFLAILIVSVGFVFWFLLPKHVRAAAVNFFAN